MSHGSSSRNSTVGDKNIIGFDCTIYGNPIVGDNSGNGKRNSTNITNKGGGINVIPPKTGIPPETSDKDSVVGRGKSPHEGQCARQIPTLVVGRNSSNKNVIEATTRGRMIKICGDNEGNDPPVKRDTKNGRKNSRDSSSRFRGHSIIGDNSGNIGDNPNGGGNKNLPPAKFNRKNVIRYNTKIEGDPIVGDNSGNIDDNPNGGGNNNINNLLQSQFNYKNATERDTWIKGNYIVGDVSGNNKGEVNTRIEWNSIVGDMSGNQKRAAATTNTTETTKRAATNR